MGFGDVIRRLRSIGQQAGSYGISASTSVAGAMGIKSGLPCPIGVDLGAGSLKLLQVHSGEPPSLISAACIETPSELVRDHAKRLEFQFEATKRLVKQGGFKGRRAVCSIPAHMTTTRHLSIPKSDGLPLGSMVAGAMAQQLGVSPDSLLYRHFELETPATSNRVEVLCLAVSRESVDQLMRGLVDAKLEPVGMHSEFVGILRAFDYVHRRTDDSNRTTLYLDVGSGTTKLIIAHGREPVFARSLYFGGRQMDETICRQLKCELNQANEARLALDRRLEQQAPVPQEPAAVAVGGEPPAEGAGEMKTGDWGFTGDGVRTERRGLGRPQGFSEEVTVLPRGEFIPPQADLSEPLESLNDEVQMCIRHHANLFPGRKIERVVFIGGEARHRGLCQHIARQLRLGAQIADPLARVARHGQEPAVGVDFRQPQPGWTLALGLCVAPTDL